MAIRNFFFILAQVLCSETVIISLNFTFSDIVTLLHLYLCKKTSQTLQMALLLQGSIYKNAHEFSLQNLKGKEGFNVINM